MLNIKKIFLVSKNEYLRWLLSPRILLFFMVWVFINTIALQPLFECANDTGKNLCIFEPFVAVGNSPLLMMIIPLGYVTMMADFPRTDRNALSVVSRCGRLNWALGQMLFSIYAALSYCIAAVIFGTLPIIGKCFTANEWSDGIRLYDIIFPDKAGSAVTTLLPKNLYNQLSPLDAAINTFFLMLLCLLMLSTVMLLFRLAGYKKMGFFLSCALTASGAALAMISSPAMWAIPTGNAIVWKHFTEYFREPVFPLWGSYLYFALFIVLLITAAVIFSKKSNFESTTEED